jgi:hypothetical protein
MARQAAARDLPRTDLERVGNTKEVRRINN